MKILVCAATAMEITPFLNEYNQSKPAKDIDVLVTGIGLTATTYSLTKYFSLKRPDLVIQAGVGGCFNKKLSLGSVLAIKQETIADESVIELKSLKTLFDLKLVPRNRFPFNKGWLINPGAELLKSIKLKAVKGISVNEITTSKQKIDYYIKAFHPVVESMEGAAFHYTCLMENIPFLQVRSISNYIGERNKKKWNMKESIVNLNKELLRLLTIVQHT
ncbi:MAG: futalosine hydrolase [Bacteroidota bacterium]